MACLREHDGVVRACDFSPDSTLLATCSWDKTIHIHSSSDFDMRNKLVGHKYGVSGVRFSPCGRVLASCSWDDTIGLWDMHTGALLGWLRGHTSPVVTCHFLHGGSVLASCSWDGTVRLWDISSSASFSSSLDRGPVLTLQGHPDAVYDFSVTPINSNLLASCGRNGSLVLWDLRSQAPWQSMLKRWTEWNSICWSPCGSFFIAGDNMGELHHWDMASIRVGGAF